MLSWTGCWLCVASTPSQGRHVLCSVPEEGPPDYAVPVRPLWTQQPSCGADPSLPFCWGGGSPGGPRSQSPDPQDRRAGLPRPPRPTAHEGPPPGVGPSSLPDPCCPSRMHVLLGAQGPPNASTIPLLKSQPCMSFSPRLPLTPLSSQGQVGAFPCVCPPPRPHAPSASPARFPRPPGHSRICQRLQGSSVPGPAARVQVRPALGQQLEDCLLVSWPPHAPEAARGLGTRLGVPAGGSEQPSSWQRMTAPSKTIAVAPGSLV